MGEEGGEEGKGRTPNVWSALTPMHAGRPKMQDRKMTDKIAGRENAHFLYCQNSFKSGVFIIFQVLRFPVSDLFLVCNFQVLQIQRPHQCTVCLSVRLYVCHTSSPLSQNG